MKRDLLVFGSLVTAAGIVGLFLAGWNYVNSIVTYGQVCTGMNYNTIACQTAIAQTSLTPFWMIAGLAVLIIGLWATARAFIAGEDALAPRQPQGRLCPVCRTWQAGPFCGNDGTKLQ